MSWMLVRVSFACARVCVCACVRVRVRVCERERGGGRKELRVGGWSVIHTFFPNPPTVLLSAMAGRHGGDEDDDEMDSDDYDGEWLCIVCFFRFL